MEYKTTIGLEIHVQLKTKSKMFCSCDNKADEAAPNTLVCPVCLGLPGVLPVVNRQAIEWTLKTALALNCQIAQTSRFDRKHYFYPDLPKNYQISQYDMPFATGGWLEVRNQKSEVRKINLTRIHLEEDAGKLIHTNDAALVDLNRAGTPLLEIVTEPEISSSEEAKIFMQELRSILRFLSVSDANMEKGHLRCDANISISEVRSQKSEVRYLGTPVEIKNLNSFRMVERALIFEEKRQKELLEKGEKIVKETRGWNDNKGETYSQRGKEYAQDYRYFPEPDIPPFEAAAFDIAKLKKEIPELPAQKRERYLLEYKIPTQELADILAQEKTIAEFFEKLVKTKRAHPVSIANWIVNILGIERIDKVDHREFIELLNLLENHKITGSNAKEILEEMLVTHKSVTEIIKEKNITPPKDQSEIANVVNKVVEDNSEAVNDIIKGKNKAIGFLVGQAMAQLKGQADPSLIQKLIKNLIEFKKEHLK